jgi:chromatin segregation and condensation protein Rec8/ScpA/Scc1 (kleisin family)
VIVGELDLDLEAFEGPFDLLLTLVLKDELPAGDVDVAAIVVEFCEQLAERDELDLESCGEFLVLVAGLLELRKGGEVALSQSAPFAPIRVARASSSSEEVSAWSARSA